MITKDKLNKPMLINIPTIKTKKSKDFYTFVHNIDTKHNTDGGNSLVIINNIKNLLIYLIESEINNLRYWNSPSTFHKQDINHVPTMTIMSTFIWKEEKIREVFQSAFSVSHKLSIKLVQRYPWIEKKFKGYVDDLGKIIYMVSSIITHY